MKYVVWKELMLHVEVEAESEQDAIDTMLDMDDAKFSVIECDYGILE